MKPREIDALRVYPTPKNIKKATKIGSAAWELCGMSYGVYVAAAPELRAIYYKEKHGHAPNKEVMKKLEAAL